MKRYRVLKLDFDTRASLLSMVIEDSWEERVKAQWHETKRQIAEEIAAEFGPIGLHQKLQNLIELEAAPMSIVAFHNRFLRQARNAFVACAYYPALTAACALGERILNQLVLALREHFRTTSEYKKVHGKDSFDHWHTAIGVLDSWSILRPEPALHRAGRDSQPRAPLHAWPRPQRPRDRSECAEAVAANHRGAVRRVWVASMVHSRRERRFVSPK